MWKYLPGVKRPASSTSRSCGSKRLCSSNCSSSSALEEEGYEGSTEDSEFDHQFVESWAKDFPWVTYKEDKKTMFCMPPIEDFNLQTAFSKWEKKKKRQIVYV